MECAGTECGASPRSCSRNCSRTLGQWGAQDLNSLFNPQTHQNPSRPSLLGHCHVQSSPAYLGTHTRLIPHLGLPYMDPDSCMMQQRILHCSIVVCALAGAACPSLLRPIKWIQLGGKKKTSSIRAKCPECEPSKDILMFLLLKPTQATTQVASFQLCLRSCPAEQLAVQLLMFSCFLLCQKVSLGFPWSPRFLLVGDDRSCSTSSSTNFGMSMLLMKNSDGIVLQHEPF